MKVTPVAPPQGAQNQSNGQASQQDARARAIARVQGPSPVQNQNAVSPEEMSAIIPANSQEPEEEVDKGVELEATSEETAPEAPKVEETAASQQYAQLARREKAIRAKQQQMEQEIKAKEASLQAREAELEARTKGFDPTKYISKAEFEADPYGTAAKAGMSVDELYNRMTERMINQTPTDPRMEAHISKLEAKLAALEQANEEGKKSAITEQERAYKAAVTQIKTDVKQLVFTDPAYEMVKVTNSVNDVVELIEKVYHRDGTLLSVEEAAEQVENYLLEEALKLSNTEKIKQKMKPASTAASTSQKQSPTPTSPATPAKQPQQMKTLTNTNTSSRTLSARERALLAFKGELK